MKQWPKLHRAFALRDQRTRSATAPSGRLLAVTVTTRIGRTGRAIRAALAELSPAEADRFEREYRHALTRAAETLDLSEAEAVLNRWWGVATLRANPPTLEEQRQVQRLHAGEDIGWPSPAARAEAHRTSP